jgi:hypothetical protein
MVVAVVISSYEIESGNCIKNNYVRTYFKLYTTLDHTLYRYTIVTMTIYV